MGKVNSMQMGEINLGSYKFWGDGIWTEENSGSYTPSSYAYVAQDAVFGFGFWDVDQVTADPQKLQAFNGTISTPVQAAYDRTAGTYASNITFAIFNTGKDGEAAIESSIDLSKSANNVFAVGMYKEGTTPYFTEYSKETAYSNVVVKAGASVKVGKNGYVYVGSAYDSEYDTQAELKDARFVLTVEGEVISDDYVRVGNTGSLIVQNGGYVKAGTLAVRGDVTIKDGSEVSARYINVYGEDWADDANTAVNYATITVKNASLELYKILDGDRNGTFQIGHKSNANRGGKLILDNATLTMPGELIVTANGFVEMKGASSIQVGSINAATEWLNISVEAADLAALNGKKILDITSNQELDTSLLKFNGAAFVSGQNIDGYYVIKTANDIMVTTVGQKDLWIDKDYTNQAAAEADGHIYGWTAFENVASALEVVKAQGLYKVGDTFGDAVTINLQEPPVAAGLDLSGTNLIFKNGHLDNTASITTAYGRQGYISQTTLDNASFRFVSPATIEGVQWGDAGVTFDADGNISQTYDINGNPVALGGAVINLTNGSTIYAQNRINARAVFFNIDATSRITVDAAASGDNRVSITGGAKITGNGDFTTQENQLNFNIMDFGSNYNFGYGNETHFTFENGAYVRATGHREIAYKNAIYFGVGASKLEQLFVTIDNSKVEADNMIQIGDTANAAKIAQFDVKNGAVLKAGGALTTYASINVNAATVEAKTLANKGKAVLKLANGAALNVTGAVENEGKISAEKSAITMGSLTGGSMDVTATTVAVAGDVDAKVIAHKGSQVKIAGDFVGTIAAKDSAITIEGNFATVPGFGSTADVHADIYGSTFDVNGSFNGNAKVAKNSTFKAGVFNGVATVTDSTFAVAGNFSGEAFVTDSTFAVATADGSVKLAGDIVIAGDFIAADIAVASKVNMSVVAGKTYTDDELFGATDVAYGAGKFVITAADDAAFGGVITVDAAADTNMTIGTLTLSGAESFVADENVVTVKKIELSDVLFNRNGVTIGKGFADVDQVCIDGVCYNVGAARDTTTGLQFTLNDGVLTANKILNIFDAKNPGVLKLDGADYYGGREYKQEIITEGTNVISVKAENLGEDSAYTRVFAGNLINEAVYSAQMDLSIFSAVNTSIQYQVYGGSNVQESGRYVGTADTIVMIDNSANPTYKSGSIFGGSRVEGARLNITGDNDVTVIGGSYQRIVGGNLIGAEGNGTAMGNSTVTVKSATVTGSVYGGGFVQSTGKYLQVGSTEVTVTDAVIGGSIYGGHAGASTSVYDASLVGDTYITIAGASTVNGNIFGGSYNLGAIIGNTNITISGNADINGFINGDSSNAIYYGVETCVSGLRNLTFDGYTATSFDATHIVNIDMISFENGSKVVASNANVLNDAEILDWTFEDGSSFAGAGVLDFEGSTLHVKEVFDADLEDWTLVAAGEIKNFDKLEGAFAVNGSNQAMTWNGVDAYELTYAGTDYKLFQDGNSIKFTATLA